LERLQKEEKLEELAWQINHCQSCGLCEGRLNAVPGEGNPDSQVVFVGEAPGREEDKQGRPFVGSAGRLLDRLLGEAGFGCEVVYIANILKCRPPGNRRPKSDEMRACAQHLDAQLEVISPLIVAPMGNSAVGHMMKKYGLKRGRIGRVHGEVFPVEASWGRVCLFPLYHPAAVLYNRRLQQELKKDLESLKGILDSCGAPRR
jgi:uracil-DNA glycosylase family 4